MKEKGRKNKVVIEVTGEESKSGKTSVICSLLKNFNNAAAIKLGHLHQTGTPVIIEDPAFISVKGKDTEKMMKAGAKKVIFVDGKPRTKKEQEEIFKKIIRKTDKFNPVFIEGGSFFNLRDVDLKLFIDKASRKVQSAKNGGKRENAHFVIDKDSAPVEKLSIIMNKLMSGTSIERKAMRSILAATRKGIITCESARKAAIEASVPPSYIGYLCTIAGIRINDCALGCFGKFSPFNKIKSLKSDNLFHGSEIVARHKVWLEKSGKIIMGEGRYRLLKEIQKEQSINGAARKCKISYRKAWEMLHWIEKITGHKVIETETGGRKGGHAILTPFGKMLMQYYEKISSKSELVLRETIQPMKINIK